MNSGSSPNPYQQLRDLLNQSNRILVVSGSNGNLDIVAALLGLSEGLRELGKAVNVVYSSQLPSESKSLLRWEEINTELTKNFVITLASAVGNVEKVSYYTEGDDLNLVVHPHPQAAPFSPDQVKYKEGGGDYDLIFVVGSRGFSDLGKIYSEDEDLFTKANIVNIDNQADNARFGKLNMVYPKTSSLSEIVTRLVENLEIKVSGEGATNLLAGIIWATNDFRSPTVSADTFEAAAFCLRSGAQRLKITSSAGKPVGKPPTEKREEKTTAISQEFKPKQEDVGPKQDWLKPKIYQRGQLI